MSATGLLFVLIGVFIIINAGNLVSVVQGKLKFHVPSIAGSTTTTTGGGTITAK